MCGRARLSSDVSEIELIFFDPADRPTPNIAPSWNVAPTDPLPVVRCDLGTGERSSDVIRWGLTPFGVTDIKAGFAKGSQHNEPASMVRRGIRHLGACRMRPGGDRAGTGALRSLLAR
jgi:putative SOS response-associated peptidase YedK